MTIEHSFTSIIKEILSGDFGEMSEILFSSSHLIQYLNVKTRSANRGSKSRGSFANLYAVYVLIEDYINHGYDLLETYSQYEGAVFTNLLRRQRELPFGSKLQNYALNSRMNEEFKRYFPTSEYTPILRDVTTNRYWINENLLKVIIGNQTFNLARSVIKIIDNYVRAKLIAFEKFIDACKEIQVLQDRDPDMTRKFVISLLASNVDARIFEIVSYSILKFYYYNQTIYFGFEIDQIEIENLKLYKTGRTNANDGGIDFVMKPLGRFFQVTETLDVRKYFLDIDKIERYPITFVIKSEENTSVLRRLLEEGAVRQYPVRTIVERYMSSIEEIINIPVLVERFGEAVTQGYLGDILNEIIKQSKVEFNYDEEDEDDIEVKISP